MKYKDLRDYLIILKHTPDKYRYPSKALSTSNDGRIKKKTTKNLCLTLRFTTSLHSPTPLNLPITSSNNIQLVIKYNGKICRLWNIGRKDRILKSLCLDWLSLKFIWISLFIEYTVTFQLPGIRHAEYWEAWEKGRPESKMAHK